MISLEKVGGQVSVVPGPETYAFSLFDVSLMQVFILRFVRYFGDVHNAVISWRCFRPLEKRFPFAEGLYVA